MRIYNGTKKTLTLPYAGGENLTIAPKTPSGNVLCSTEFLSTLVTSYGTDEIAIIASGPFEITACANIPTSVNYVVQSLEEAIIRFHSGSDIEKVPEKTIKAAAKDAAEKIKKVEIKLPEEPKGDPIENLPEEPKKDNNEVKSGKAKDKKKDKAKETLTPTPEPDGINDEEKVEAPVTEGGVGLQKVEIEA